MSGAILDGVKAFKSLVVDKIVEYFNFIKSYDNNMKNLEDELKVLCAKKLDIDTNVKDAKVSLRVMTRDTANWLQSVQELIEREEMKKLMKDVRVSENVVKMMEQRAMKRLFEADRETFDIVVRMVIKKCSSRREDAQEDARDDGNGEVIDAQEDARDDGNGEVIDAQEDARDDGNGEVIDAQEDARDDGNGEVIDAQEDADYQKIAKIAFDVMGDTVRDIKKFIKEDNGAVAAVKLLSNVDLEKLMKNDQEMAKALTKAEEIIRKDLEHDDHGDNNVQRVDTSNIRENVGRWRTRIGSLMEFLDDEKFKNSLPDGARVVLEAMGALSTSVRYEHTQVIAGRQHRCRCCGYCVTCLDHYRHRHDFSQTAETMAKDIKAMIDRCPQGSWTRLRRADELETISYEFMEGLESREQLLQNILSALKDDRVNVVGIHGMGGAGKTTLAKTLANKKAIKIFNKRIVVEVSEAPNVKGIQDQIAESFSPGLLKNVESVHQRASKLLTALKSEKKDKILIILDNVWKKLNIDEVGIPREKTKDFCCKLLITTREEQVCRVMGVEEANIFPVGLLNDKEALALFENKIGKEVEGGYKPVADKLLKKCGGLPLAIAATASALKDEDLSVWNQFANESVKPISSQVGGEYREIYSILETSFKLMENEEKRMFFYLACLSPLDSAISVDDLMRYGIGLDLFQRVNNLSEAMRQASGWANELVSSSLLIKDDLDEIRIHDVVRDSAISFVEKGKDGMMLVESIPRWMCKETLKKFRAISLLSGHHDFSSLSGVEAPMLQILLLKGDISTTTLSSDFFQGMTNLKVLSLSNMDFNSGLPTSIGQLQLLKTLHLHKCRLTDIKLIAKLGNLLVLSLSGSTFKELPVEFRELCNLRLLDIRVDGIGIKINIPRNILSRLLHLEGLYTSNCFNDLGDQAIVSELNELCHLNVLEMEVPQVEQLLTVNEDQLVEQLNDFKIFVGCCGTDSILRQWKLPLRRALILGGIDASQYKFMKAILKKTVCLVVVNNGSFTENFVPQLDEEGFKDLICLSVIKRDDVQYIISPDNYNDSPAFVNLQNLELDNMGGLKMICDGNTPTRSFCSLQRLELRSLPLLKYGLPLIVVPLNLVKVDIYKCDALEYIICGEKAVTNVNTDIIKFPYLKTMKLNEVARLASVLGQGNADGDVQADQPFFHKMCAFPCLEELELQFNKKIMTLWSNTYDISSLHNLKRIKIDCCEELRSLGSPSICHALVHLENLSIQACGQLEHVITKETTEKQIPERVIVFARLKELQLSSIKSFYGGSYKLEFPSLESLFLNNHRSTHFVGSEHSTTFFCDKIAFPCLERLVLSNNEAIVTLWSQACVVSCFQNLKTLDITKCWQLQSVGSLSVFAALVHLEDLVIIDCDNLQEVVSDETDGHHFSERIIVFRHLKRLQMYFLSNLKWFCTNTTYTPNFQMLKKLEFYNCTGNSIDFVKPENSTTFFSYKSALSSIEHLDLRQNQTIVTLWSKTVSSFQNLKFLKISYCKELQCLGPMSVFVGLVQLEDLEIKDCDILQEVICDDGQGHQVCENIIVFPRLRRIYMKNLPNLQTFCGGYCLLKFPVLEYLKLSKIRSLANFVKSESSTALFSDNIEFPSLETLKVDGLSNKVLSLWNLSALGKWGQVIPNFLKRLEIGGCENMDVIIAGEHVRDQVYVFPRLKSLTFDNLPSLSCFAYKPSAALHFPSLETVELWTCTKLQSFCSGPFQAPKLKSVSVWDCSDMLFFLSVNMSVVQELPSLDKVEIEECPVLLSFTCEPLDTPKLRVVLLTKCPKIKWFSPGGPKNDYNMLLPCLDDVAIKDCSSMQSFCAGQIDAPNLSFLSVDYNVVESPLLQNLQSVLRTTREVKEDTEKE